MGTGGRDGGDASARPDRPQPDEPHSDENRPDEAGAQALLRAEVRRQLRVHLGRGGVRRITCADGDDGPDLLVVLTELAPRTPALLVEPEPVLARHARAAASDLGLEWVQVRTADPGAWDTYETWGPADLLLTGGVLGQARDADVPGLVAMLTTLLAPGGLVLWTREGPAPGPAADDGDRSGEHVRRELVRGGFDEVVCTGVPGTPYRVGVHRLAVPPRDGEPGSRLLPALDPSAPGPG